VEFVIEMLQCLVHKYFTVIQEHH